MSIPEGLIALWTGTLGDIPPNWSLCDGNGGTPNLIARFVRGAPAGTNPGSTGGSDTHNHTTTAAGTHTHSPFSLDAHEHSVFWGPSHMHGQTEEREVIVDYGEMDHVAYLTRGSHNHTMNAAGSHTHTLSTPGNHTHTISSTNSRPPFYEVAFIQAQSGAAVATGLIIIWTGTLANIPSGWDLCDGGGGRPNLRSRFVRGINTSSTNPGTVGGSVTHTHTISTNNHNHSITSAGGHTHSINAITWTHNHHDDASRAGTDVNGRHTDTAAGSHGHSDTNFTGSHNHGSPSGTGGSHNHMNASTVSNFPAYYEVAYIINSGASDIPLNGILIWVGTLATIPSQYQLCNGEGGRADLRSRFVLGADSGQQPGSTGGSDSHNHTDQNDGHHADHSMADDGYHVHDNTSFDGAHTHAMGGNVYHANFFRFLNNSAGSHDHEIGPVYDHSHTGLGFALSHNHQPWGSSDTRPAYYEVAFVQRTQVAVEPTVTTQSVTNPQETSVTGNGNITNTGGENCFRRGFCYMVGTSGTPTVSDTVEDQSGSYGTGSFSLSLTGLSTGTPYRVRAFAENSAGIGYGSTVQTLTRPAAPTNVAATNGSHTDRVRVTWTKSTGATGYKVQYWTGADWSTLDTVGDVSAYNDYSAAAPTITPGTADASDGDSSAHVVLTLSGHSASNGASRTYRVIATNTSGDSSASDTDSGYRGTTTLTFQWQRSAADSDADYSNITGATSNPYNDTGAPAPSVTPGDANASNGTHAAHVALEVTGHSATDGAGRYYRCVVSMSGATSQTSSADRGYRGGSALTYQWQMSAGDSDANYSNISGAVTNPYNATQAPADGSGRYFRCYVTGELTTADRGYRITWPALTTQAVSDITGNTATGNATITDTGGEDADERGVCWNTTGNPTVANETSEETPGPYGTGAFDVPITGLDVGTLYYVRGYAHNSAGYGYADQVQFTTRSYLASGHIGDVIDCTEDVRNYVLLAWEKSLPSANQGVQIEVRSSPDNVGWSDWQIAASSPFNSFTIPTQRYFEWRATLTTSEGHRTPALVSLAFYWRVYT